MDEHLNELMRQCATATPLGRLSGIEQERVFAWLIDGGHMTRTGKPLERPRQAPRVEAYTTEGKPIYGAGADHRPTETVTMPERG
jgi:hypothetical protein